MVAAYQEAKTYEDRATVQVSYKRDGKLEKDEARLAVRFERPNRVNLNVYQLELVSNGKEWRAYINDPPSNDLDGQVVARPAPAELALSDLIADDEMRQALGRGPCGMPVQLDLLLAEKPLEMFLSEKSPKKLLADAKFEDIPGPSAGTRLPELKSSSEKPGGRVCYRVEVTTDSGVYVFWIDRENYVLRRLEFPTTELAIQIKEFTAANGGDPKNVSDVRLSADFHLAALQATFDNNTFAFAMPADGKLVPKFMRPPQLLPPKLFGHRPPPFSFTTLSGEPVSPTELQGKIAVLMWFVDKEPSRLGLAQLDKVREEFAGQDGISFLGVFADPKSKLNNEQLRELLERWEIKMPIVRDERKEDDPAFPIPEAPTLVVLDAEGKVQIFEPGANPNLAAQFPKVLKRLQKGADLAAELAEQVERRVAAYQMHISQSGKSGGSTYIQLTDTKIAPWQDPELFKLTRLWTCDKIEAPGNLLVVDEQESKHAGKESSAQSAGPSSRILVCNGLRGVVELDADGKVVARHELPKGAAVSFLRTAVDRDQKRYYLAGATLERQSPRQIVLLDSQWNVLWTYPPEGETSDGVVDAQLFDLDGKDTLEVYVGFGGSVGVQQLDLAGKRIWSNRHIPSVLTLTQTPPNEAEFRKLLVTGEKGLVLRLNQFGIQDPDIRVGDWKILRLFASRFSGRRQTQFVGLAHVDEQKMQAVALDEKLQEQWSYPLPEGAFRSQIEHVTSGMLLDADGWFADVADGQWVFPGANGSVHLVSDEGNFNDFFNSGENLSGIAAARFGDSRVLLLSSDKGVTAWKVERN